MKTLCAVGTLLQAANCVWSVAAQMPLWAQAFDFITLAVCIGFTVAADRNERAS